MNRSKCKICNGSGTITTVNDGTGHFSYLNLRNKTVNVGENTRLTCPYCKNHNKYVPHVGARQKSRAAAN